MSGDASLRSLVFMTAREAGSSVCAAIESLAWQTHPGLHVLFVDDGSRDDTGALARRMLQEHFHGRHTFVRNECAWGMARNTHVHLRAVLGAGDFVLVMDAAEQVVDATLLARIGAEHAAGFDVVWTDRVADAGGASVSLDPFLSPREQPWPCAGLFSFRAELLQAVTEGYFQDEDGHWLLDGGDRVIGYPILDQTRRWRHLAVPACRRTLGPAAVEPALARAERIVLGKSPLPCVRWLFAEHAAADQAVSRLIAEARTASPSPAVDPWAHLAVATLVQRCPTLLPLMLDGAGAPLEVPVLWRWWQWLQGAVPTPRVLAIGAGALAPALHAMVAGLGGQITSVCATPEEATALQARLRAAGLAHEVQGPPLVDAAFSDVHARFPDLGTLPASARGFDLAIVGAACSPDGAGAMTLALPMLSGLLADTGFMVCVWSPAEAAALRAAHAAWSAVAPDLGYEPLAMAGDALVVRAG